MEIRRIAVVDRPGTPTFVDRHAERIKHALPRVELVVALDAEELKAKTKGIHALPITDHVLAYIFAFLRAHPFFREAQRRKEWDRPIHVTNRSSTEEGATFLALCTCVTSG